MNQKSPISLDGVWLMPENPQVDADAHAASGTNTVAYVRLALINLLGHEAYDRIVRRS